MFTLIGRTFIAYDDNLGRSTVGLLTQSQGNTNEDEWFDLLTNLITSKQTIYAASFRGMLFDITEIEDKIIKNCKQDTDLHRLVKELVFKKLKGHELTVASKVTYD